MLHSRFTEKRHRHLTAGMMKNKAQLFLYALRLLVTVIKPAPDHFHAKVLKSMPQ